MPSVDLRETLQFAGFRLDPLAQRLWRGAAPVELRPSTWSLLMALLARPGELVSNLELADELWPGGAVTPKALTNRIAELREALGDDSVRQHIIETVPRRGYRFLPMVARRPPAVGSDDHSVATGPPALLVPPPAPTQTLSEDTPRRAELQRLHHAWTRASVGHRQLVLVGGEPGIGKTWLVDRFLAGMPPGAALVGRSQCASLSSERESFGPWLSLLADLCAGPQADSVVPLLRRCAPTWLMQLPWLQQADDAQALRGDVVGTAIGRMLREGCALLEALARVHPLLLVLEDLHWADAASVDLLHSLLQGRAPVSLLVVATWRPADAQLHGHPLCALAPAAGPGTLPVQALTLHALDADACIRLLQAQGLDPAQAARLQPRVMRLAQGNPLVMLAAAAHLQSAAGVAASEAADALALPDGAMAADAALPVDLVPASLRHVVAVRLAVLPDSERALLQAASVVGPSFTPGLVAAALQADAAPLAQAGRALAARQLFVRSQPDAAEPARLAFVHDAYRQALYDSLPLAERQQMHGRVARCIEQQVGLDPTGMAPVLADAYTRAALPADAARWLDRTAQVSLARFDHRAAVQAMQAALQQLALLPPADEGVRRHQLRLHLDCGNLLNALRVGHPDAPASYAAADALAGAVGDSHSRVRALLGLTFTWVLRGRPQQAVAVAADLVRLAEAAQPGLAAAAHTYAGIAALAHGLHADALRHGQRALDLPCEPGVPAYVDLPSLNRMNLGMALVETGDADAGLQHMAVAVARSRARSLPHDLMQALYWAAEAHRIAGDAASAALLFREALAHADRLGIEGFSLAARFGLLASSPAAPGRSAAMAVLLDRRAELGEVWHAAGFLLALAEACLADGDAPGCQRAVAGGLALQGGAHGTRHQAALRRLSAQGRVADAPVPIN